MALRAMANSPSGCLRDQKHPQPFRPAMALRRAGSVAAAAAPRNAPPPAAATQQQEGVHAPLPLQQQQQQQQQQDGRAAFALAAAAAAFTAVAAGPAAAAGLSDVDPATAHSLETVLRPLFAIGTILYIIRIPMTWYPSIDGTKLPWLVAYAPTEPVLKVTRKVIPLVGGVDITPIVWVALLSFFNEILLGPQGILMLIQRQSGAGL